MDGLDLVILEGLEGLEGELEWNPFKSLKKIKINLKPPRKIRANLGPIKITVTRKDWIRGPATAAMAALGPGGWGALYAAYRGWIPGIKMSKRDKAWLREKAAIAAGATAAVGAAALAPAVVPAVGSAVGSAAGAVGSAVGAAGSALVKGAKSLGVDKAIKEGIKRGLTETGTGITEAQVQRMTPPQQTGSGQTGPETGSDRWALYAVIALGFLYYLMRSK